MVKIEVNATTGAEGHVGSRSETRTASSAFTSASFLPLSGF